MDDGIATEATRQAVAMLLRADPGADDGARAGLLALLGEGPGAVPAVEALREERGAMERARAAKARSEASFAAARKRALESMARCARMRKGSGKKGLTQRQGGVECHS